MLHIAANFYIYSFPRFHCNVYFKMTGTFRYKKKYIERRKKKQFEKFPLND